MAAFSSAFSPAFFVAGQYIGPMAAQVAIAAGWPVVVGGGSLSIGGRVLVGPGGKVYAFASEENALKWAEVAGSREAYQAGAVANMSEAARAAWVEKKRARLYEVARRVTLAAARQSDAAIRAALLREVDLCLSKWA